MQKPLHESVLADLRQEILWPTVALLLAVGLGLLAVNARIPDEPPPWAIGFLLLALVLAVWALHHMGTAPAAWGLNVGLILSILLSWHWFPEAHIQHALLLPALSATVMLGPRPGLALALVCHGLLAFGSRRSSISEAEVLAGSALLWACVGLVCLAQARERRSLFLAWAGHDEARRRLEAARERQVELKQALQDLVLAKQEADRLNHLLSAATRAVEEARRAKEEFVANVSHELRTPLNMIIGFSEMIGEAPEVYSRRLPPALMADVAAIKRNAEHLAGLVDDVLDLAEAEAGRTRLLQETTPLREIVVEAVEAVSALFAKKGLALALEIPEDLPPVYCDRTRIREVLLNLLSNAGRYAEVGGATVRAVSEQGMVTVTIADTGPGVDSKVAARLFEPFQHDQAMRRRLGGTGLGLAISKRFVELHGGRIWLESAPGQGTRASFTLPSAPPPVAAAQRWLSPHFEYAARSGPSLAPVVQARPRLIVVEQGQALGAMVARYSDELEPVAAASLAEARELAESTSAVAILVDEPIPFPPPPAPATDAEKSIDIPIISCTMPHPGAGVAGLEVQGYLVKPIACDELLAAVRHVAPGARSILLADDDPDARQLFSRMLASAPERYTVSLAENGEMAIAMLRARRPAIVLLDLLMPNGGGAEVLAAKTADPELRGIPTIVVSAKGVQRAPLVSPALTIRRLHGLTGREVMAAVEALTHALQPRFGAAGPHETPGGS